MKTPISLIKKGWPILLAIGLGIFLGTRDPFPVYFPCLYGSAMFGSALISAANAIGWRKPKKQDTRKWQKAATVAAIIFFLAVGLSALVNSTLT